MRVKICGITRRQDAELAVDLGAAALGFIFWPPSPRFIDPYRARAIALSVPPLVTLVGVFADQPAEYVRGVSNLLHLGAVQLHGREPLGYCRELKHRVIKAVPVSAGSELDVAAIPADITLLLDAHDPVRLGGTGSTIDWQVAARLARQRRIVLSGGLHAGNVEAAIATVQPFAVDVASGVEARPGVKDHARLREFLDAVRRAAGTITTGESA